LQLRLLTTGRDLIRLQQPSAPGSNAAVVANPSFDRQPQRSSLVAANPGSDDQIAQQRSADIKDQRWAPLPATEIEGRQVSTLLGVTPITGDAATTLQLQKLAGPRVLHVATHGFFLLDQTRKQEQDLGFLQTGTPGLQGLRQEDPQLRSGLVLAGANEPGKDPNDDGYLTAAEAVALNLKGTELVVLSACSTGQGDVRTGEGVYGLQRSLTVAGARSTLLSLWKVNDEATAAFMERFYKRLKAGESRSDALAATQQEFRNGIEGKPEWKQPYYWAAWQLVGDWRPIKGL
jgi:CHAT domain-containing protein